jgi:hypothetical protein
LIGFNCKSFVTMGGINNVNKYGNTLRRSETLLVHCKQKLCDKVIQRFPQLVAFPRVYYWDHIVLMLATMFPNPSLCRVPYGNL